MHDTSRIDKETTAEGGIRNQVNASTRKDQSSRRCSNKRKAGAIQMEKFQPHKGRYRSINDETSRPILLGEARKRIQYGTNHQLSSGPSGLLKNAVILP